MSWNCICCISLWVIKLWFGQEKIILVGNKLASKLTLENKVSQKKMWSCQTKGHLHPQRENPLEISWTKALLVFLVWEIIVVSKQRVDTAQKGGSLGNNFTKLLMIIRMKEKGWFYFPKGKLRPKRGNPLKTFYCVTFH